MAQIKTFEAACKVLKLNPKNLPDVKKLAPKYAKHVLAQFKLVIITEALNEGWKPNWKDINQEKWWPWFEMNSSSGFRFYGADCRCTHSCVPSRLCFKNSELVKYAAKQFGKLYKDYFTM